MAVAIALLGLAGVAAGGCAASNPAADGGGDAILARAFRDRVHDLQVQGRGVVVRLLGDDTDGARHQRFVLRLESGQTLLVAHNTDVAPRVEGLEAGDSVSFSGVYEWSAEGRRHPLDASGSRRAAHGGLAASRRLHVPVGGRRHELRREEEHRSAPGEAVFGEASIFAFPARGTIDPRTSTSGGSDADPRRCRAGRDTVK